MTNKDTKWKGKNIFKAKKERDGKWIYGLLTFYHEIPFAPEYGKAVMTDFETDNVDVVFDTVCQSTGVCDKNGDLIFEGDIVRFDPSDKNREAEVYYDTTFGSACFRLRGLKTIYTGNSFDGNIELTGRNIHD